MLKKILKAALAVAFVFAGVYYLGALAVELLIKKNIAFIVPMDNIFFDEGHEWFRILNIFAFILSLLAVYSAFSSKEGRGTENDKRIKDKKDKEKYSYLAGKREIKRGLVPLEFAGKKEKTCFAENTLQERWDLFFDPFRKTYNKIITKFYHEERYKLRRVKHWKIGGKDVIHRSGLPVLATKKKIWVDAGDTHSLVIGTTSSGKTWSVVLPMIELARLSGECVVINDPKGELYGYTAEKFKNDGYEVICLNFVDPEKSDCWNPLEMAIQAWTEADKEYEERMRKWKKEYEKADTKEKTNLLKRRPYPDHSIAMEMLDDIAGILCESSSKDNKQWDDFAKDMIKGFAALILEEGEMDLVNFKSIQLCQTIGDEATGKETTILKDYLSQFRDKDAASAMALSAYTDAKGNTKGSMLSVFKQKLSVMTKNELIMRMTSRTSFDMKQLGQKKMAIYLIVHDEKTTYYQLVTIFIKQLYEVVIKSARGEANLRLPVPVNLILDEFGACPALKDLSNMLVAGRSRGVRFTMFIQELEQLVQNYGKPTAETIKGQVMNLVYILSGSLETVKEVSNMCGTEHYWSRAEKRYKDIPVLSVDRLSRLGLGEAVVKRQRWNPYLTVYPPYDSYPFYTGLDMASMKVIEKPPVKYFDIKERFKKRKG